MGNAGKPGLVIFVFSILGFLVAIIEQICFDNEYLFHLYVEAAELPGLQIVTIIAFMLGGCVLAALSSN